MIQKENKKGKLGNIVHAICESYKLDEAHVRAFLVYNFPELKDHSRCPNCEASMKIDLYSPDVLDGLLLIEIGKAVKENIAKGMSFTEANIIHVPTLPTTDAIRHRTTRCSYLNYIKQPDGIKNSGRWVLTSWGWQALKGYPVPKTVRYFRGKLVDRGEEKITLTEMFQVHNDKVKEAIARRTKPKSDQTSETRKYSPSEWVEFGGLHEGTLFNESTT